MELCSGKTPLKSGNIYELNEFSNNLSSALQEYDITGLRFAEHSGGGDRFYLGLLIRRGQSEAVVNYNGEDTKFLVLQRLLILAVVKRFFSHPKSLNPILRHPKLNSKPR